MIQILMIIFESTQINFKLKSSFVQVFNFKKCIYCEFHKLSIYILCVYVH